MNPSANEHSRDVVFKGCLSTSLPHLVVLLWLSFLGVTVWSHAQRAEIPPIYDASTYFLKARNVWKDLHENGLKFINPLDVEPTIRPPGTILMSYPAGFSADFRGFYFRSVFFPIGCLVLAVYIASFDLASPSSAQWNLALLAIFASGLPLFYHFESSDLLPFSIYWGLVDNFFAGVTALAAAATIRSVTTQSMKWWCTAVLFASFCIFVKPAGAVVIIVTDLAWGLALVIEYTLADLAARKRLTNLLVTGTLAAAAIEGAVFLVCFRSRYLSRHNIAAGSTVLQTFETYLTVALNARFVHAMVYPSFGYVLPATTLIVLAVGMCKPKSVPLLPMNVRPVTLATVSVVALFIGLWFFNKEGGGNEIRYFYPFALFALTCASPLILMNLARLGWLLTLFVRILWIIPCLNLAALLVKVNPPVDWQRWSGVSLISGSQRMEISQAKSLLSRVRESGKDAKVYTMDLGTASATFASVADYSSLLEPDRPRLFVEFPVNWDTATFYRIQDIVDSGFLLFEPISDEKLQRAVLSRGLIHDFFEEGLLFRAWLSTLAEKDGVATLSDSSVRLLRVEDPMKLRTSLEMLVSQHFWPDSFVRSNSEEWLTISVFQSPTTLRPQIRDTNFGSLLYLHALTIKEDKGALKLTFWWEWKLRPQGDWRFFCHVIDREGNILDNHELKLATERPAELEGTIRSSVLDFASTQNKRAWGLAFGIYMPVDGGTVVLEADKGNRDWGNRRVIVPLGSGN